MKRILDEDDLLAIQDTIQREIDENSFSDNYATSDRQGGAAISTKVNSATSGNFKVLLTDDSIDTHGGKQLYQDTDLIYDAGTNTINTNVTHANTANYFSEAKKIELSGDVTGSALSNGESGWSINTFLKKIIDETAAGPNDVLYGNTIDVPYIEVDEQGRVKSLINKQFTVPGSTLEDFGDGTKHYGWNGTTVNSNIGNNNEGEVFNSQLSWGSTIKIPNFLIDNKGRVQTGWTSKYTLPAAPDTPDIPNIDKVKLTDDVTGEGTFSNGICTISTKLQANPVKSISITGDVTGTGEDKNNDGNWTINTSLVTKPTKGIEITGAVEGTGIYNTENGIWDINTTLSVSTWTTSQSTFTTGATPTDLIINKDISQNILIACWIRLVGTAREISNTNLSAQEIGNNIQIVVPVKPLLSDSTFTYPMYYPYLKKNSSTKEVDIENGTGDLTIKYNRTNKQIILTIPGYCRGTQFFQGLL